MVTVDYTKSPAQRIDHYDERGALLDKYNYFIERTELKNGKYRYDVYAEPVGKGFRVRIGGLKASNNPNFVTVRIFARMSPDRKTGRRIVASMYSSLPRFEYSYTKHGRIVPCRNADLI